MQQSKTCPKCESADIIRIPAEIRAYGGGNTIWLGATVFSAVKVTRLLCGSCGFIEEWVDSADGIAKLKEKYSS